MTCSVCRGLFGSDHNKRTCARRAVSVIAGAASEKAAEHAVNMVFPGLGTLLFNTRFIYKIMNAANGGAEDSTMTDMIIKAVES